MTYRADLHCHSIYSDGSLTPIELIELAKKNGLSGLSITDHDTLNAYSKDVYAAAKALDIDLFTGVEFSARFEDINVHILGYGVELTPGILSFCKEHLNSRNERNALIIKKLRSLSFVISEKELYQGKKQTVIGRPHIATLMVQKGYVNTFQDAFNRYLGEGRCCYSPGKPYSVEETLLNIKNAGGKAFVAHPHLIRNKKRLQALLELDFDGIECFYSKISASQEKPFIQLAHRKGLLVSGGSDFHGVITPHIQLGCSWTDKKNVEGIFEKKI